jgi:D-alanyl-D-alanine carboxypeptidase
MKKIFILVLIIFLLFISILNFSFWRTKNIEYKDLKQSLIQQREIIKNLETLIIKLKEKELKERELLEIQSQAVISVLVRENQKPKILFEKNINKELPIASLVKLMTAHIVLRYYNLDYKIKISEDAILQLGDAGNLKRGQKLTVKELLFPLLIESSNDAAFALTETIGQEEFVYLMNSEAERLGLKNTFFINPSGLDPVIRTKKIMNYSTIQDLVKFTKYLLNSDKYNNKLLLWDILSTEKIELYGQTLINTNELLNEIPGIVGGKTGWTSRAGGSLLLVLKVPDGYLINIILGAPTKESRFEEMEKLINWIKEL